jgi:hypothetical protein
LSSYVRRPRSTRSRLRMARRKHVCDLEANATSSSYCGCAVVNRWGAENDQQCAGYTNRCKQNKKDAIHHDGNKFPIFDNLK